MQLDLQQHVEFILEVASTKLSVICRVTRLVRWVSLCLWRFVRGCQNLKFIMSQDRVLFLKTEVLKNSSRLKISQGRRFHQGEDFPTVFTPVSLRRESSLLPECLMDFLEPDK